MRSLMLMRLLMSVIPIGISDSEKIDLNPSIVTVVIGENNTVRWTNQDNVLRLLCTVRNQNGLQVSLNQEVLLF